MLLLLVVVLFGGVGLECIGAPDAMLLLLLTLLLVPSPGGGGSSGFSDIVCVSKSFLLFLLEKWRKMEKHFSPIFPTFQKRKGESYLKETAYKETNGDAVQSLFAPSLSFFLFCVRVSS